MAFTAGTHSYVIDYGKDISNCAMARCLNCEAVAHAFTLEQALQDLAENVVCFGQCSNCRNLAKSASEYARPQGDRTLPHMHICPNDNNMWRRLNPYDDHWELVTSLIEWNALLSADFTHH